jgi:predicted glycosyltransferase
VFTASIIRVVVEAIHMPEMLVYFNEITWRYTQQGCHLLLTAYGNFVQSPKSPEISSLYNIKISTVGNKTNIFQRRSSESKNCGS